MNKKVTWDELPQEIQERMLDCQVEQGNPRYAKVFEKCIEACFWSEGFDWEESKEKYIFWKKILIDGNIDHFYTVHPKQSKFQPIAMKCTQEQWDELKPELEKLEGVKIRLNDNLDRVHYIVNNYDCNDRVISNTLDGLKTYYNRTVHETFNKQIFLNSLGVKVEEKTQEINSPTLPILPYGAQLICREMEVSDDDIRYIPHYVLVKKEYPLVAHPYMAIMPNGSTCSFRYAREIDPQRQEKEAKINELEKQIAELQETVNKLKGE